MGVVFDSHYYRRYEYGVPRTLFVLYVHTLVLTLVNYTSGMDDASVSAK